MKNIIVEALNQLIIIIGTELKREQISYVTLQNKRSMMENQIFIIILDIHWGNGWHIWYINNNFEYILQNNGQTNNGAQKR